MAEGGYYRCDGCDMLAQRCVQRLEFKWDRWFNSEKLAVYHTDRQFIIRGFAVVSLATWSGASVSDCSFS
jgi:hypothetical protein